VGGEFQVQAGFEFASGAADGEPAGGGDLAEEEELGSLPGVAEAGLDDPGIIEEEEVLGMDPLAQLIKTGMLDGLSGAIDDHQAGMVARFDRVAGDLPGR
jgi:hypothetical protein